MKRYQPNTPRAALAAVAVAMAVLTVSVAVIAPAKIGGGQASEAVTAAAPRGKAPIEVAIVPGRIDVLGYREKSVAIGTEAPLPAKRSGDAS